MSGFQLWHPSCRKETHLYRPQPSAYTSPERNRIFYVGLYPMPSSTTVVAAVLFAVMSGQPTSEKVISVTAGGSKACFGEGR